MVTLIAEARMDKINFPINLPMALAETTKVSTILEATEMAPTTTANIVGDMEVRTVTTPQAVEDHQVGDPLGEDLPGAEVVETDSADPS